LRLVRAKGAGVAARARRYAPPRRKPALRRGEAGGLRNREGGGPGGARRMPVWGERRGRDEKLSTSSDVASTVGGLG